MLTGLIIATVVLIAVTALVVWLVLARRRRDRWEQAPAEPEGEAPPASPPGLERPTLASLDLANTMARAVAWADQAERDDRGFWRAARGDLGPEEYLQLFAEVQDLLPDVFGDDIMGLTEGDPPEISLRVEGQLWVVALQRQDGFLDESFWTFLNRALEARGRAERLAAPRLANWRFPLVVSTRDELRELREQGLGFVGNTPPLHPRPMEGGVRFHKRPMPEPELFLRDLGQALGVGPASAGVALERLGLLFSLHLRKYRMLQLGSFGSFQLRVGPRGNVHLRFRAARALRERVANPVMRVPHAPTPSVPGMDDVALRAVLATAEQHLSMGCGAVDVPGFGLFWRELQPASIMRHPQNQQPLMIPARRDVVFEPGAHLLEPLAAR